jgi:hypothetical protein
MRSNERSQLDTLEATHFSEAVVSAVADDDVIQDVNAEQSACSCESSSDCQIVGRRSRIAGRVQMTNNDGCCVGQQGGGEHSARFDQGGVERAAAHFVIRDDAMFSRQA